MKLPVIGSGMMGSGTRFDERAREVAARVNKMGGDKKVRAVELDAADQKSVTKLMPGHDAALSAVFPDSWFSARVRPPSASRQSSAVETELAVFTGRPKCRRPKCESLTRHGHRMQEADAGWKEPG